MKARLLELLGRLLLATGAVRLLNHLNRRRLLVVMYHGVRADGADYDNWCQLPEARFVWQLDYLRRYHRVVPVSRIAASEPLPDRAAAITFDDGYRNNVTRALPRLRARGLPAAIFLVTGALGGERLLWPERLFDAIEQSPHLEIDGGAAGLGRLSLDGPHARRLSYGRLLERLKAMELAAKQQALEALIEALGPPSRTDADYLEDLRLMDWPTALELQREGTFELGAHTVSHEILSRLPDAAVRSEVLESCAEVRRRLAPPTGVPFAYPNGRLQDFDPRAREALREAGATLAFTTESGLNEPGADRYALRRISVGADMTPGRFVLACTGLLDRMRRPRGGAPQ